MNWEGAFSCLLVPQKWECFKKGGDGLGRQCCSSDRWRVVITSCTFKLTLENRKAHCLWIKFFSVSAHCKEINHCNFLSLSLALYESQLLQTMKHIMCKLMTEIRFVYFSQFKPNWQIVRHWKSTRTRSLDDFAIVQIFGAHLSTAVLHFETEGDKKAGVQSLNWVNRGKLTWGLGASKLQ